MTMFEYLKALFLANASMLKGEKGQDLAEYALLIGLIALIVVAAVTLLGGSISTVLQAIADAMNGVAGNVP
jgi:pilus assembly protein Flp/PilA